jgi:hypothetical protein
MSLYIHGVSQEKLMDDVGVEPIRWKVSSASGHEGVGGRGQ